MASQRLHVFRLGETTLYTVSMDRVGANLPAGEYISVARADWKYVREIDCAEPEAPV